MGVLCAIWHNGMKVQILQLKKLDLKSKKSGLIQKYSSDHIAKMMVTCKKISSQVKLQWFDTKMCVDALKLHYMLYSNGQYYDIFMMNHLRRINQM
jgi:hypothetical protein